MALPEVRVHFNVWLALVTKRKGLQLALEPLYGQGIAGYVPKPKLWVRPRGIAPRENSHVVSALRMLGDIEAFTLGLDVDAQADDDVDHLVEDRRTDARPHQRGADAPGLRDHLGSEVVVRDLAGGVVHDARAAEGRIHQDAGAERADDAADAVDTEHIERVVIAERILHHGAEEQADHTDHEAEHDRPHRTGITGRGRHRDESCHR